MNINETQGRESQNGITKAWRGKLTLAQFMINNPRTIASLILSWVLWVEYSSYDVGDKPFEKNWVPEASYPANAYDKCTEDAENLATRWYEGMKNASNVRESTLTPLIGNRFLVLTHLKTGGTLQQKYACFPDTIHPK